MAKYTGAVRFPDGELRFFIYNGTVDMARPQLFQRISDADDAWDNNQGDVPLYDGNPEVDEVVEVMPFYSADDHEVQFFSRADRNRGLITGPLSLDRAIEEQHDHRRQSPIDTGKGS